MEPIHPTRSRFGRLTRGLAVLGAVAGIAGGLPAGAQAVMLQWEPSANLFWAMNSSALLDMFQNGQCTELAANRRPDVVETIVTSTVESDLQRGVGETIPNFDARYWGTLADQAGLPTGHRPEAGALMVFQPGVLGAGSAGHIAYVQSVRRHWFTISEMHAPNLFKVSHETLRRSAVRRWGVRFIY